MSRKNDLKSGSVGWESPSNIAFIKYWGKRANQLPCNPSLSMSLKNSVSSTQVKYFQRNKDKPLKFLFEGKEQIAFEDRILKWFNGLNEQFSFLNDFSFEISSENTFPHSTGIASSASAMSSLALCLCSIEEELSGNKLNEDKFLRKASLVARLGSGSASRSVYGGYAVWGKSEYLLKGSDEYAVDFSKSIHSVYDDFQDAILIVSSQKKEVSSSAGHGLMKGHPYADARFAHANVNFDRLLGVMKSGELNEFVEILENEALSLHGLMMNSNPSYTLLKPNTLEVIEKIRNFRQETKIPVGFTLDAGPNVHLLYPKSVSEKVISFIKDELLPYLENGKYILDEKGNGPQKLNCN